MEKTVALELDVQVDDKEDYYCGWVCRFRNGEWCELFDEGVKLDTIRADYSPFGVPSTYKYFRCENCVEATEKKDKLDKAIDRLGEQVESLLATIRALDLERKKHGK